MQLFKQHCCHAGRIEQNMSGTHESRENKQMNVPKTKGQPDKKCV